MKAFKEIGKYIKWTIAKEHQSLFSCLFLTCFLRLNALVAAYSQLLHGYLSPSCNVLTCLLRLLMVVAA